MNNGEWVFHDSYKTQTDAVIEGNSIVNMGLVKGVRIEKKGKKSRPFLLYILPHIKN